MGGGTLQLSSYGGQDIETVGNPQMSFFKSVYKKHTNFAIETIQQQFEGTLSHNECKVNAKINKNGDLIHKCFLDIKFPEFPKTGSPDYYNWTNSTAHAYVKEVSLFIGELLIDKHVSEWFDIWNELTVDYENDHLLVNKHLAKNSYLKSNNTNCKPVQCYVPLQFWFNKYANAALPLIALQYHDVKIEFLFRDLNFLINTDGSLGTNTTAPDTKLFVDFIFLDVEERKQFAQKPHQYLIEQLQYVKIPLTMKNEIKFNHTVKELIWVCRNNNVGAESTSTIDATLNVVTGGSPALSNGNDYFNYSTLNSNNIEYVGGYPSNEPFSHATLTFNGIDRFNKQRASYFRTIQPINYHKRIPNKHIYCYSFALKPEILQPTGTCNFSRMHTAFLEFENITSDSTELIVFATNYNILVIKSGMGGLKYSN